MWLLGKASSRLTMFRESDMVVYQLQYIKRRDALPITRDFMFEAEARLHAAAA